MAEKNRRQYGWPIPKHLEGVVATLASTEPKSTISAIDPGKQKVGGDIRMAAGMGKLQEIDLGPEASAKNILRTEEARRRLEGLPLEVVEEPPRKEDKVAKPGRKRRQPKRRNSDDLRRDMMVEAVLKEAKCRIPSLYIILTQLTPTVDYFEEDKPPSPTGEYDEDADDAFYEQFRREFESSENRNQRKLAPPPGPKGVKDPPKGPKLGGSRSARAAMRLQEEQAAKKK